MTKFGHKLNYVINTFVKHTPALQHHTLIAINHDEEQLFHNNC